MTGQLYTGGLTTRQRQVLRSLNNAGDWVRPLDIGGTGWNNTSGILGALVRKGYAEKEPRGGWSYIRGSYRYRITDSGRDVLELQTRK